MKKNLIALMIFAIFICSCKEEDVINSPELTSTQACLDYLTAENIFNDVGIIVEEGLENNGKNKSFPTYNLMNLDTSRIW